MAAENIELLSPAGSRLHFLGSTLLVLAKLACIATPKARRVLQVHPLGPLAQLFLTVTHGACGDKRSTLSLSCMSEVELVADRRIVSCSWNDSSVWWEASYVNRRMPERPSKSY